MSTPDDIINRLLAERTELVAALAGVHAIADVKLTPECTAIWKITSRIHHKYTYVAGPAVQVGIASQAAPIHPASIPAHIAEGAPA